MSTQTEQPTTSNQRRSSSKNWLGAACIGIDQHKYGFQMRFDEGKDSIGSPCGSLLTCVTILLLLAYTAQKMIVLSTKSNISIVSTDINEHFGSDYTVQGSKNGLNLAVGVASNNDFLPIKLDPAYGYIEITSVSWG